MLPEAQHTLVNQQQYPVKCVTRGPAHITPKTIPSKVPSVLPEAPHKLTTLYPAAALERAREQMTVVSCCLLTGLASTGLARRL
jgi:hypothetical protein